MERLVIIFAALFCIIMIIILNRQSKFESSESRLVIVTPCSRPENLDSMKDSIDFSKIKNWYIIYDTRNKPFNKKYTDDKIIELECKDEGIVGHQIRNMALNTIKDSLIYFLDDDNIIHPSFWNINFDSNKLYTFDMQRKDDILKGNKVEPDSIDTAQYVFDVNLVGDLRFDVTLYNADGFFIQKIYEENKDKWVYVPEIASYYNKLR